MPQVVVIGHLSTSFDIVLSFGIQNSVRAGLLDVSASDASI